MNTPQIIISVGFIVIFFAVLIGTFMAGLLKMADDEYDCPYDNPDTRDEE